MPFRRLHAYKFRGLLWAALGFVGLTTLAMGYTVWQLRSDAIDDAYKDTGNIATVLSEQIAQTVRSIDLVIRDIQERILLFDITTPIDLRRVMSGEIGHAILKSRLDRFALADVITVLDSDGRLVSTSRTWPSPRAMQSRHSKCLRHSRPSRDLLPTSADAYANQSAPEAP